MTKTITTAEELDALPRGTVVHSTAGTVACRFDQKRGVVFGSDYPFPWDSLQLPLTVLFRPDQPAEPVRCAPSRDELLQALNAPVHAPMGTHHPGTGECLQCPWPVHEMPAGDIAEAVQALYANQRTEAEVKAEAWEEAATWFDADLCGVSLIIRDRANRLSAAQPTPVFEVMGLPTPEVPNVGGEQHG